MTSSFKVCGRSATNRNRLLIHVHGGCYVNNPDKAATLEAIYAFLDNVLVAPARVAMPGLGYTPMGAISRTRCCHRCTATCADSRPRFSRRERATFCSATQFVCIVNCIRPEWTRSRSFTKASPMPNITENATAPESREAFEKIVRFFDIHLGK
jgi:hypothetical protein